ncbi:class I SAM-dependent methyltransferase [Euzebya sp.]|uniref:class I SAM-dependent methyltransferase n=1 Tax=Euzebya sp. TaxID=1971409 RepID=UPI0035145D43
MVSHPVFARVYERLSRRMEQHGNAEHRRRLLADLHGRVIEVGAGNGLNFAHYPPGVDGVLAVEPEPRLRRAAIRAAQSAAVPITVVDGLADALPAADGSVDAAVASLVLCSVPDQSVALAELHRILQPGGELRFYEYVRAHEPRLASVQRAVDHVWPYLAGGCHTSRRTVAAIKAAGFVIDDIAAFRFPETRIPLPPAPHVIGVARRASS